mmetsp:Transcript_7782/g.16716  ORF Transcript_7782/g.16716 Transcript_7782/m.16716 type:complete len:212 (-) Transcript_7782:1666-2301(-)
MYNLSASGCFSTLVIFPTRMSRAVMGGPSYSSLGSFVAASEAPGAAADCEPEAAAPLSPPFCFFSLALGWRNSSGILSQKARNFSMRSAKGTIPAFLASTRLSSLVARANNASCLVTSCPLISPVRANRTGWNKFFPLTPFSLAIFFMCAWYVWVKSHFPSWKLSIAVSAFGRGNSPASYSLSIRWARLKKFPCSIMDLASALSSLASPLS